MKLKKLPFKASTDVSLGVELEFQIVDPITYDLTSGAKDLIRNISASKYQETIKPEITQSMIEINSSIHHSPEKLRKEFSAMHHYLLHQAKSLGVLFCGGGTHPFQQWIDRKIFPSQRYKNISRQYRYLSKRSTVFGLHVHVGCSNPEKALYLTHALARYVPQFITISASSPFYQGIDTGYNSSRSNVFNSFPLSGTIPYLTNWDEFSAYYYKMRNLKIISSMKDFYWDIRPKPEFGTVEIRVCDTPLTIERAITIAAYIQTVARFLLLEKPIQIHPDLYYLYNYNRFQACRYGFDGIIIDPCNLKKISIHDDILHTINLIEDHARQLKNRKLIRQLTRSVTKKQNDAVFLRKFYKKVGTLPEVTQKECLLWSTEKELSLTS